MMSVRAYYVIFFLFYAFEVDNCQIVSEEWYVQLSREGIYNYILMSQYHRY